MVFISETGLTALGFAGGDTVDLVSKGEDGVTRRAPHLEVGRGPAGGTIVVVTRTSGDAPADTVSQEHFIGMYLAKDDPWDTATKWHDQRKYAVAMASLPRPHYRRAYEPGCSIGLLTRMLAARCDEVLAVDCVDTAVDQAVVNTADLPNVTVGPAMLPADLPGGTFDLIVIGDLLYYLSADDLTTLLDGLADRLEPGGDLLSVHFRDRDGDSYDGFAVHDKLLSHPALTPVIRHEDEWFVLDVLRKDG